MHIFLLKHSPQKSERLLETLNPDYHCAKLNDAQIKQLLDHADDKFSDGETTEDYWKIYRIYFSATEVTPIEFEYLHRPQDYPDCASPDYYYGDELSELSKLAREEVFYIWEQHLDKGWEVFAGGERVSSVVCDTHGPRITVNGEDKKIPSTNLLIVTFYHTGKVLEANTRVPKEIRESVRYKKLNRLSHRYLCFIRKDISNFDTLTERIRSENT
jgi:hypothetical protein